MLKIWIIMQQPLPLRTFRFGSFQQSENYHILRPSGSGDHLMIYTIAGRGRIDDGRASRELKPGDALLYRPGAYQSYGTAPSSGTWRLAWAHFEPRPHWAALIQWPRWKPDISVLNLPAGEVREQFTKATTDMVACYSLPSESAVDFSLNRLEEALLWANLTARNDPSLKLDPRIRGAMDYFAQNLSESFSLTSAARSSGMSPSHFSHLFRQQTGKTPQRFSEELRLAHAGFLLQHSSLAVAEIAGQCGYDDPLYFSRRFRLRNGLSPAHFRSTIKTSQRSDNKTEDFHGIGRV